MKKYILYIIGVLLLFGQAGKISAQQDAIYNMYLLNQFVINPAYAGARDAISIVGDMRNQWVSFPGAPKTSFISVHAPIKRYNLGYGLSALSDAIGAKNNSAVYGTVSYILKISSNWKLSFGLRAGITNYKFDLSKTSYKDATDNSFLMLNNYNKTVFDMDAGIYLRSRGFYTGLSITHINQAKVVNGTFNTNTGTSDLVYTLVPHTFFIIGKSFFINNNFLLNVNYLHRITQGSSGGDLSLNTLLYNRVWLGVFGRSDYGGGALIQLIVTKSLRIGYSYDVGGGIKKALGPTHEIMIGWDIRAKNNTSVISPRFL